MNNTSTTTLRELDDMDEMLDKHFSNDKSIKGAFSHLGLKRSEEAVQNLRKGHKKREENGWYEKTLEKNKDQNKDELWKYALSKGLEKRAKNNEWRENVTNAIKKTASNPKVLEKRSNTIKKRKNDPAWKEKCAEEGKKRMKPVMTPDGEFDSRRSAAKHYKCADSWIGVLIKKYPDKYYYITK